MIFSTQITFVQQQSLNKFSHVNQQKIASHWAQLHTPHTTETKSRFLSPKLQGWVTQCNCLPNATLGQSFCCCWMYTHHFPVSPAACRDLMQGTSSAIRLLVSRQAVPPGARNQLKHFSSALSPTPINPRMGLWTLKLCRYPCPWIKGPLPLVTESQAFRCRYQFCRVLILDVEFLSEGKQHQAPVNTESHMQVVLRKGNNNNNKIKANEFWTADFRKTGKIIFLPGFLLEIATIILCKTEDQENYLLPLPTSSYMAF